MRAASVVWLGFVFTVGPGLSGLATQPIKVQPATKADGSAWIVLADPAGVVNVENGIAVHEPQYHASLGSSPTDRIRSSWTLATWRSRDARFSTLLRHPAEAPPTRWME